MPRIPWTNSVLSRVKRVPLQSAPRTSFFVRAYSYPKEGVFQPNSPPRNIPGFGPAPPLGQSISHPSPAQQPLPTRLPAQDQPSTHSNPNPQTDGAGQGRRQWTLYFWRAIRIATLLYFASEGARVAHEFYNPGLILEPDTEEDNEEYQRRMLDLTATRLFEDMAKVQTVVHDESSSEDLDTETEQDSSEDEDEGEDDQEKLMVNTLHPRSSLLEGRTLAGTRGLESRFFLEGLTEDAKLTFVCFGPATCGWPGVVHGGAITTLLLSELRQFGAMSLALPIDERHAYTSEIDFKTHIEPNHWYVVRSQGYLVHPSERNPSAADQVESGPNTEVRLIAEVFCVDGEMPLLSFKDGMNSSQPEEHGFHLHASAQLRFEISPKDYEDLKAIPGFDAARLPG